MVKSYQLLPYQLLPFYFKKLTFKGTVGEKITSIVNCRRCFCISSILQKKKGKPRKKDNKTDEVRRLEREAPFLFQAVKAGKAKQKRIKYEPPIIFQPLPKKQYREDDFGRSKQAIGKKETVFILQPKQRNERTVFPDHRLTEAEALINSVHSWAVHAGCIEPIRGIESRFYFGPGKGLVMEKLSHKILDAINNGGVTMVFVNTEKLTVRQIDQLESTWGCKVFDRCRVILELFKEKATTREMKLQVLLAETQFLRPLSGTGETKSEKSRRVILDQKESTTKKDLHVANKQRSLSRTTRINKRIPHVAMVGYTNAGKTALAKALSRDDSLKAEDKLFATLDSTVHRGMLPSGLNTMFVDTIGFISGMPHELIDSFATTLEDVKTADVLVHVTDCSHPELTLQKQTVDDVLKRLNIPKKLMRNKITVANKVDIGSNAVEDADTIAISATEGTGIEELRKVIEKKVIETTGRGRFRITCDPQESQLRWLYVHGTVLDIIPHDDCDDGIFDVVAILDQLSKDKFEREFGVEVVIVKDMRE